MGEIDMGRELIDPFPYYSFLFVKVACELLYLASIRGDASVTRHALV